MAKEECIARYTADELKAMLARGEDRTDWTRAAATKQAEIEAQITADPDEAGLEIDWTKAAVDLPSRKAHLNMRIDRDVLDFFRRVGRGYQTKINAVLRAYVNQMQK